MSDKPILFSGPMVRALLAGTKTQTRRVLKPQPFVDELRNFCAPDRKGKVWIYGQDGQGVPHAQKFADTELRIKVGDRLWVREAWTLHDRAGDVGTVAYAATFKSHGWTETIEQIPRDLTLSTRLQPVQRGWRPSIHMPRWASRLTLTVTEVRVERLQDISVADAVAEGALASAKVDQFAQVHAIPMYRAIWTGINGDGLWEANPWVAAYTFTVQHGNIDHLARAA